MPRFVPCKVAYRVDEEKYVSVLPRFFQVKFIRVFCREPAKEFVARYAFERWCQSSKCRSPFPSCQETAEQPLHELLERSQTQ